jgi:type I restriction enzyme R subunit
VEAPKNTIDYIHYFCGTDTGNKELLKENEPKRLALYKTVVSLIRSYANVAPEYEEAGYTINEITAIKQEVEYYEKIREEIKLASGDYVDMKLYDPAMRQLIDMYIRAEESEMITDFDHMGLIDLIINKESDEIVKAMPKSMRNNESMGEAIENNVRKLIIDERPLNPKYYDKMSELLDEIIRMRKEEMLDYKEYLEKIKALASKVKDPSGTKDPDEKTPSSINTSGKKALYDNLEGNADLVMDVDEAVRYNKKDSWNGNLMKERRVRNAVENVLGNKKEKIDEIMEIIKQHNEYK